MPKISYTIKNFRDKTLYVIDRAEAICEEYSRQGYDLTLRQLYYQFVARGWIANKDTEYDRLGSIINDARLAGLIDWNHLTDRTRNLASVGTWEDPTQIVRAVARQYNEDKWLSQSNYVEVWVEKEALAGVASRAADTWDVPSFACRGYVSQSEMWRAARRLGYLMKAGKTVTILHLGDHDPSGIDMTRDNEHRLHHFISTDLGAWSLREGESRWEEWMQQMANDNLIDSGLPMLPEIKRIALNMDQVRQYNPPPNPAKLTDSRVGDYIERFGNSSWELDALPPDVLDTLIQTEITDLIDTDAWDTAVAHQEDQRRILTAVSDRWDDVKDFLS